MSTRATARRKGPHRCTSGGSSPQRSSHIVDCCLSAHFVTLRPQAPAQHQSVISNQVGMRSASTPCTATHLKQIVFRRFADLNLLQLPVTRYGSTSYQKLTPETR